MIDSSPDLTKLLTILRFYLLIFDNVLCPPSRLCNSHLQPGDIRPVHVTASISQCNQSGVALPRIPRKSRGRRCVRHPTISLVRGDEQGISRRYGKAGRPASSSSDRITLQRTCHQHVVFHRHLPPNMDHAGCVQQMPWSALTQKQVCPRRHTRHTCPHDPKDLPSYARTDGKCRAPPRSVLLKGGTFSSERLQAAYPGLTWVRPRTGFRSRAWLCLHLAHPATIKRVT